MHDYRPRHLVAFELGSGRVSPVIDVARYVCARPECGAIWQVLPALVARHLWRAWSTVEGATFEDADPMAAADVPERTRARWWERLCSSARLLVQLFASESGSTLEALAQRLGLGSTRFDLVGRTPRTRAPRRGRASRAPRRSSIGSSGAFVSCDRGERRVLRGRRRAFVRSPRFAGPADYEAAMDDKRSEPSRCGASVCSARW